MVFAIRLVKKEHIGIPIDPIRLAKHHVNGFFRCGAAAKIGKAKQVTNTATLGLPLFFSRFIFYKPVPKDYPYALFISDEDRKKMGKKRKKNKK